MIMEIIFNGAANISDGNNNYFAYTHEDFVFTNEGTTISEKVRKTIKPYSVREYDNVNNPILTGDIVSDRILNDGVADPFIVKHDDKFYMFFEVLQGRNNKTETPHDEIGCAVSNDLINWSYIGIVLGFEDYGQRYAYPNVFKHKNEWYMIPDCGSGGIRVYKAIDFPTKWEYQTKLISTMAMDTNIFNMNGVWYMTSSVSSAHELKLYYNTTDDWLNDNWVTHPLSPIIKESDTEKGLRNAGRYFIDKNKIVFPVQVTPKNTLRYGEYTVMYTISDLTKTSLKIERGEIIVCGSQCDNWNGIASHHISYTDTDFGNIYAVDGTDMKYKYSIGLYVDGKKNICGSFTNNSTFTSIANSYNEILLKNGEYNSFYFLENNRIKIKRSGYYLINICCDFADKIKVSKNDIIFSELSSKSLLKTIYFKKDDEIKIEVYTTSAISLNSDLKKTWIDIININ